MVGRRAGRSRGGLRDGGGQKGGLQDTFEAEVVAEIEALVGPGAADGLDFEAIETAARRQALQVAARAVERRLNADTSDYPGPRLPCPGCGKPARYAGRPSKTFTTVLGAMKLSRAYYHCDSCKGGSTRMVGLSAAMVSFAESSDLMDKLASVPVNAKQVERTAEALGREIARDEQTVADPESPSAPTMYLGMDGTGVPIRASELKGRQGKQADGSAKTREVKLVTVWTAEGRDKEGIPTRDPGSVSYSAAIETAATCDTDKELSPFAQRVGREARRRGFDQADRRAVLGDGALWIWNLTAELFPGATQIVDLYHAKEHLSEVAKAIYGVGSDLAGPWARQRQDDLDEGKLRSVVAALRAHAEGNEQARKCMGYVIRNRCIIATRSIGCLSRRPASKSSSSSLRTRSSSSTVSTYFGRFRCAVPWGASRTGWDRTILP